MAGLAMSPKKSTVTVIKVKDKKEFLKQFNKSKPSKELFESYRKAGRLFGIED